MIITNLLKDNQDKIITLIAKTNNHFEVPLKHEKFIIQIEDVYFLSFVEKKKTDLHCEVSALKIHLLSGQYYAIDLYPGLCFNRKKNANIDKSPLGKIINFKPSETAAHPEQ